MTGSAVKEARLKASKWEEIIINSASSTTYLEVTKNSKFDSQYNSIANKNSFLCCSNNSLCDYSSFKDSDCCFTGQI